jgi:hypothetical protein
MAKKSLFAFFDVASKVTKNLGNGVAALTLDKSYQTQRAGETLGHIPQNFVKGLQYGAQSLVQNVKKGITGLIVCENVSVKEQFISLFLHQQQK